MLALNMRLKRPGAHK